MRHGIFRDGHPYLQLTLPGVYGSLVVEFILDTGFDGDIALPDSIARQIDTQPAGSRNRLLADGSIKQCRRFEMLLNDDDEERSVEILVLEGRPLVGTHFLIDNSLHIDVAEGGEVLIESM